MPSRIVLSNRENVKKVEIEEQLNFIFSVMLASGVPEAELDGCLTDGEMTIYNKISFRKLCEKFQISVVDDTDDGVKLYMKSGEEDILVAEWYKPTCILRIDHSIPDRSKKIFIEIHTRWWTFEENDGKDK